MGPVFDLIDFGDEHSPVRKLIKIVLLDAMSNRAALVRFEEHESCFRMSYQVDGTFCEMVPPPPHLAGRILNLIRVIAQLDCAGRPRRGYSHLRMGEYFIHVFAEIGRGQFGERADLSLVFSSAAAEEARNLLTDYNQIIEEDDIPHEPIEPN